MDARKIAEQAINDLFDMSEREGRCISKDAATDLLERHIRAGMEIQPGFNADGTIYTLTKDQLPRHVAMCAACHGPLDRNRRQGTTDSDFNVLAPPYCPACGMNKHGATHAVPARVIQFGTTSARGLMAGAEVHCGGYVWHVASDGVYDLRSWPQTNGSPSGDQNA